jgi:hypothetical protein
VSQTDPAPSNTTDLCRFIKNEQWRKEFGTDELVKTFEYKEKPEVSKYYPQYYHKTDKVSLAALEIWLNADCKLRMAGPCILSSTAG